MASATGMGYFDLLSGKWTQNVQAYQPVETILEELSGKIEAAVSKIRELEGRVERLASAERSLKSLVPKINEA